MRRHCKYCKSKGLINEILINESASDALDVDFSELMINKIKLKKLLMIVLIYLLVNTI